MPPFEMPPVFAGYAERGEDWAAWLDRLPALVGEVVADWELRPDGDAVHGHGALVLPVRTTGGKPAVLKVTYPHPEAQHEHLALQAWQAGAPSGCCAPTRTGGRCCSSGCTPTRTSPGWGPSRRARWWPSCTPGCTFRPCPS